MARRFSPHRPIFDPEIERGTIMTGSAIGTERTNVNASTITLPISIPTPTVTATSSPDWTNYWDFSNTANWTGSVSTGQNAEVGSLALKQIDASNGMGLSTINGLTCAANTGGFLSGRGEWGTDASLAAVTVPYGIGAVAQRIVGTGAASAQVSALATDNVPTGERKATVRCGGASGSHQGQGTNTITASTAGSDDAHVLFLYVDDPNSELWVDGVLEATGDLDLASLSSGARFVIITGRATDGSGPTSGQAEIGWKWGEGGIVVGSVTTDEIEGWSNDMIAKWGI